MSKKEEQSTEQQERVTTKYDLKMQRRAAEKAKAKRDERVGMIMGIIVVVALFCLVVSFPLRSWLTVYGTYIEIGGQKISRVEFEYNYHAAINSYANTYGTYLSYMGIDLTGDLSTQMYSDTLSFQDYFEEATVENLKQEIALQAEAKAAGFSYDATDEYEEYMETVKTAAKEAGMTVDEFFQSNFGSYATASRLKKIIMAGLEASAYYDTVADSKAATDEEAQTYYEENKDSYDSVDYRVTIVTADLPTEPTELADPVEETEETDESDEDGTDSEDEEEEEYEPSEAEIEYAMSVAEEEAEEVLKTIATEGDLQENLKRSSVTYLIRDWMFDSERKAGDTTIIEDESNYRYYVVAFLDRYLDETLTVNTRAIILNSEETDGEAVLDEWKSGEATEDSFAEIADKYNSSELTSAEGGLYESLLTSSISEELAEWLGDESRVSGDTTVISPEDDSYTYVLYYISQGSPEWMVNIKSTLLSNVMADYLEEITADIEVKDPKNRLNYLQVYASQEAAAAAESEAAESAAAEDVSGEDETTVDETTDGDETAADETADGDSTAEGETTDDAADEDASTETDTETTESTSAQ